MRAVSWPGACQHLGRGPQPICLPTRRSRFIEENNGRVYRPVRSRRPEFSLSLSVRCHSPPGLSSVTPDHSAASQPCVTVWSGQHAQKADTFTLLRRCESLRDLRWLAMFSRSHFAGPLARCRKKMAYRKQCARTRPLVAMIPTTSTT